jgi:hypothetical protein
VDNIEKAYKAGWFLEECIREEQEKARKERLSLLIVDLHECKKAILGLNSQCHLEIILPQTLKRIEKELNILLDN